MSCVRCALCDKLLLMDFDSRSCGYFLLSFPLPYIMRYCMRDAIHQSLDKRTAHLFLFCLSLKNSWKWQATSGQSEGTHDNHPSQCLHISSAHNCPLYCSHSVYVRLRLLYLWDHETIAIHFQPKKSLNVVNLSTVRFIRCVFHHFRHSAIEGTLSISAIHESFNSLWNVCKRCDASSLKCYEISSQNCWFVSWVGPCNSTCHFWHQTKIHRVRAWVFGMAMENS